MHISRTLGPIALAAGLALLAACGGGGGSSGGGSSGGGGGSPSPTGRAWGLAVLLSSGDPMRSPESAVVAIDAAGRAISAWQEAVSPSVRNAVWASRFDGVGHWSPAVTIDDTTGNAIAPQLAMSPNGVAEASFPQTTSNNGGSPRLMARRFDGSVWQGTLTRIDALDAAEISTEHRLAITDSGEATVAYAQSDNVTGARVRAVSSTASGVWGSPALIGGPRSYSPQFALAANGDAVMVWLAAETPTTASLWSSRRLAGVWSSPQRLVPSLTDASHLMLGADAAGNAIAVWQQRPGGRSEVMALRFSALAGSWAGPTKLDDGSVNATTPVLATERHGDSLVMWAGADDLGGATGLVARRFHAAGSSWGSALRVQPMGAPGGEAPRLALDGSGNALAVWLQGGASHGTWREAWAATFDAASERWAAPTKLMTDPDAYTLGGDTQTPQVAVNAGGDAVVVWVQRTEAVPAPQVWARVYR